MRHRRYSKKNLYLTKFRHKIFVLKIGGEVVSEKRILENILRDIKELVDHGIRVILVHGGGKQADELACKIGHVPTKINGRRVTGEKDLEIVKMLYGGSLNLEILSIMKKLKMKGIRVSGLDGDLLDVRIRDKKNFDYGFVGDINKVHPQVLRDMLSKGYMPVVSPLAGTSDGMILNINADTIAAEIAVTLKCEKLILFTNIDGVYEKKKFISTLTVQEALALIKNGVAKKGMAVKLFNCVDAVQRGVKRVHIINGLSPHSLLGEFFTKSGIGTMITSERENEIYINE